MRVPEFYPNAKVFSDGIQPNDIEQGELGSCYFLAVLSGLAEVPDRIGTRFITKDVNAAGIYLVTVFVNGVLTPVIVDDHFPTKNGRPCFSHSKDQEIWVMILEKVWAKLHGSFSRTASGQAYQSCSHLLGMPAPQTELSKTNVEDFWKSICEYDRKNYMMFINGEKAINGIVASHVYTLIQTYYVYKQGKPVRLVK